MSTEIHKAMNRAMAAIAKTGIAKLGRADAGGARYDFRGIEQAMNEMSVVLVAEGITVEPKYSDLQITERDKGGGKATRFATIKGAFRFIAEDGSFITSEYFGEAMDSGDKAVTKAQSVCFRTALFQTFVVPTMAMDTEGNEPQEGTVADLAIMQAESCESLEELEALWKRESKAILASNDGNGYRAFTKTVNEAKKRLSA